MTKSEIIKQVIVDNGLAESREEANKIFIKNFVDHFLQWNLQTWDTEVPSTIGNSFMNSVGRGGNFSVQYLIKDLDAFLTNRMQAESKL